MSTQCMAIASQCRAQFNSQRKSVLIVITGCGGGKTKPLRGNTTGGLIINECETLRFPSLSSTGSPCPALCSEHQCVVPPMPVVAGWMFVCRVHRNVEKKINHQIMFCTNISTRLASGECSQTVITQNKYTTAHKP